MSLQRRINKRVAAIFPTDAPTTNHPDKGKRDGRCNRTACQRPLAGKPQFYMDGIFTAGPRLYYCGDCEHEFTKWDRIDRPGEPLRCKPDEGNGLRRLAVMIELATEVGPAP